MANTEHKGLQVIVAEHAGFCWGVKRAVTLSRDAARHAPKPVHTYGPLIHNRSVISKLEQEGVRALPESPQALPAPGATVIIRAHGIPPRDEQALRDAGLLLIDGTCPHVVRIQHSAAHAHAAGRTVVIIGDRDHAEIKGLLGYCAGRAFVVHSAEDVATLPAAAPLTVLAQSTLDETTFETITALIRARCPDAEVIDTRCAATARTQ